MDYLVDLLCEYDIKDRDIIVIAETIVSKLEGNIIERKNIKPSKKALLLSKILDKPPETVQIILNESKEILKIGNKFIITETHHGFVCANSGVDESNSYEYIKPLPKNPDKSAKYIKNKIKEKTGKNVAVIINDSVGRPFRKGSVGLAIGVCGILPLWNRVGEKDLFGRELKTTEVGIVDELSAAASVVMGQCDEGIPVVIIRGANVPYTDEDVNIKSILREKDDDIFRY